MASSAAVPRRLTGAARRAWIELAAETERPGEFDPAALGDLPEPARRWLTFAIRPGTPLLSSVDLRLHGQIRLRGWRHFRARQVIAPPYGYLWSAVVGRGLLRTSGFDRYSGETGQLHWQTLGMPVSSAQGPDISRSAAARLAAELVLVPAAALAPSVSWSPVDGRRAIARISIGDSVYSVTLSVAQSGAPDSVTLRRWAKPGREPFAEHVFVAMFHETARFGGYTIPGRITAGYVSDRRPDGAFIRETIDRASFR
jgi:hypothetical protein